MIDLQRLRPARDGKSKQPVQARGERQKARLLLASRQTFTRLGYADTRVADIVREAGVAHGTFYTYFDSREDVLMAIARDAFQSLVTAFEDGTAGLEQAAALHASISAYIDAFERVADVMAVVEQAGALHPAVKALNAQYSDLLITSIQQAVTRGRAGAVVRRRGRSAAWAIYGALDALLHAWLIRKQDLDRRHVVQTVGELLAIWVPEQVMTAPMYMKKKLSGARAMRDGT